MIELINLKILLNLNENSYKPEDAYLKLSQQLIELTENINITIDEYFEAITDNYSGWGQNFYVSNISIKEDKPCLIFIPKLRPKLEKVFPENFSIGFKVLPKINTESTGQVTYYPFFINEFVKVETGQRDFEIECNCNIYHTKNKPNDYENIINKSFVSELPIISSRAKEKISNWREYLEWKYNADLTTSFFSEVDDCLINKKSYSFKLKKKLPREIVENLNEYGVYLFNKNDVEIQTYEDNGIQKQRLIYKNENQKLSGQIKFDKNIKKYALDNYIEGSTNTANRFEYKDGNFTIKIENIKNYKEIAFIVIIENQKRFTNTKLINNIELFQEQGGYSPFLASYLFDIKNAKVPISPTSLNFDNNSIKLTYEQKQAVQIMYDAPDIALIQGPPGTGKTTVIAECIYQYVKQGKKVMLTSESNDAVDNALERLFDVPDVIPIRLTSSKRADDSKYSRKEATKTYFQESLANPAKKIIEDFKNKQKINGDNEKTYKDFKLLYEVLIKDTNELNNIQNKINELNKEYSKLKSKEREIIISKQNNDTFYNLVEKIKNNDSNITIIGEGLSENVIEIFCNTVLHKTEKLTTNFFKKEFTDKGKTALVKTSYIKEGLINFFKSQTILSKAKSDLLYIKSLDSSEIIKNETLNKIEDLNYRMVVAEENEDKAKYDEFRKEKSKLEREKGLNIEDYTIRNFSFIDRYFIQYEQNIVKDDLFKISNNLNQLENIDSLKNDISKIREFISITENDILYIDKKITNENDLLKHLNNDLEILRNTVKNLEDDKYNLENDCQEYISNVNMFELFDLQEILDNLVLSSSSITGTKNKLRDLQLTESEINQKVNEQKCLKEIEQELDNLINIVNSNNTNEENLNKTRKRLASEQARKEEKQNKICMNFLSISKSTNKLNEFKNSGLIKKFAQKILGEKEENEITNINSKTIENKNLTDEIDRIDIEINRLEVEIKKLESEINLSKQKINTEMDSIKIRKFYAFDEIIKKIEKNNIEFIHKEVKNQIWSITEREFEIKQENLTNVLKEIEKLEYKFKKLTLKLSEIPKLKEQKGCIKENIEKNIKNLEKLKKIKYLKKIFKIISENKLEKTNNEYTRLEKLFTVYQKEDILKEKQELTEYLKNLSNINSDEYLKIKLGQNAKKDEVIKLLEYFIEVFENESKIYSEYLEQFVEQSKQDIFRNPLEEFDEEAKINLNNQIIDQNNELKKFEDNIKNIEAKIKTIKLKLKKESIDNVTVLNYLEHQIEENKIDEDAQLMIPLIENWIKNIDEHIPIERENEIYLKNVNVVGITLNASEGMLKKIELENFDVVIVDEISKATPPEYLRGMMRAKKAILVGDHRQLPPLFSYHGQDFSFEDGIHDETNNPVLSLENFNKYKKLVTASQFQEFFSEANSRIKYRLTKQFRMHTDIMDVINCFYGGQLIQGISENKEVHNKAKMHNIYIQNFIEEKDHAVWVDTSKIFGKEINKQIQTSTTKINPYEAFLTIEALKKIDEALFQQYEEGQKKLSIGIISFYLGQVKLLKKMVKNCNLKYFDKFDNSDKNNEEKNMISTVDSFQGRDRDIILVDLISTKRKIGKENFVSSFQRINVAFSRAKNLLVIFGSKDIFDDYEVEIPDVEDESIIKKEKVYKKIANIIRTNGSNKDPSSISNITDWNLQKQNYGYKNE